MDRTTNSFTGQDYYNLIFPDLEKIKKSLSDINRYVSKINDKEDVSTLKTRIGLLVQEMEKLTVMGRSIPVFRQRETEMISDELETQVQMVESNDILTLKVPLLLPKARSNKTNKSYLVSMFHRTFQESLRGFQKYNENVVIWFEFQYKRRIGKQGFRDHDNIETKIVKDLLTPYIVVDDSPVFCDDFHSSRTGDFDATYIHVVPRRKFAEYYQGKVMDYEKA